jgi:hypothetical protein
MTPAIATGSAPVVISRSSAASWRSTLSSVRMVLVSPARRTTISGRGRRSKSNAQRLPALDR